MSTKTRTSLLQPLLFFVGLTVFVVVSSLLLLPNSQSTISWHPENVRDKGTAALVTLLRNQGVEVQVEDSLVQVQAHATKDTTVVVLNTEALHHDQRERIAKLPATVVMGISPYDFVGELSQVVEIGENVPPDYVTAQCDDPDAQAASRISHAWGSVRKISDPDPNSGWVVGPEDELDQPPRHIIDTDVQICFPTDEDHREGALAIWEENGAKRYLLTENELFTNGWLADDGNAALTLRLLGKHDTLIWYTALAEDSTFALTFAPTWYRTFVWFGLVLIAALVWWRAPRFGPVAHEALPVVVKGGEIVRGVGRLNYHYRNAAHAAKALRNGTLTRLRQQLALSPTETEEATIAAIAARVNRSEQSLHVLLAGPAPTSPAQLTDLATDLAALEREVHLL